MIVVPFATAGATPGIARGAIRPAVENGKGERPEGVVGLTGLALRREGDQRPAFRLRKRPIGLEPLGPCVEKGGGGIQTGRRVKGGPRKKTRDTLGRGGPEGGGNRRSGGRMCRENEDRSRRRPQNGTKAGRHRISGGTCFRASDPCTPRLASTAGVPPGMIGRVRTWTAARSSPAATRPPIIAGDQ